MEKYASDGKVPTGVPIVDKLLDGGIPKGSSVLLRAHPLADPSTMAIQFLHNRLKNGSVSIYFVNNKSPISVIEESDALGLSVAEFKRQGKLAFIDCYSALFGLQSNEAYAVEDVTDPASVSKVILQAVSECSKKGKVFLIYDSLNTSIDELGKSILTEVANWGKIAVTFDSILCFVYTEWNYPRDVSEAVNALFPSIIDLRVLERLIGSQVVTVSKNDGKPVEKALIPIKKVVTGGVRGYIPKILVTGPFHAGKTTIVHTLSTRAVSVQRMGTTVALDFGHVDHKGFTLDLFGTVGQPRFDPILKQLGGESLGAIVVVDSTKPEEFPRAKEMMQKAGVYGLPYVVAANKQDLPAALSVEEIRKKMNITDEVPIVKTVGTDKTSLLHALDALLDRVILV